MCGRAELDDPEGFASPSSTAWSGVAMLPSAELEGVGIPDFRAFRGSVTRPAYLFPRRFSREVAPAAARAGFPGFELLPGLDLSIRLHFSSHQLPYADFDRRFPSTSTSTRACSKGTVACTDKPDVFVLGLVHLVSRARVRVRARLQTLRSAGVRSPKQNPPPARTSARAAPP
jgi:hypothetical protein